MPITRADWARGMMKYADIKPTHHNMWAIVAWCAAEGGYYDAKNVFHPGALFNPLNTTQTMPGSTNYNWNGGFPVQNYTSEKQGYDAVWKTLKGRRDYAPIIRRLRKDAWARYTLEAVRDSGWGTGGFALEILDDVKKYWESYSTKPIGQ